MDMGAVKTAFDIQVNGKRGPGRPKMTWKQLTERDHRVWKLSAIDPHDRGTWRSGVRSAVRAQASCLEGDPMLWIRPLYLHVNKKSDDNDDDAAYAFTEIFENGDVLERQSGKQAFENVMFFATGGRITCMATYM